MDTFHGEEAQPNTLYFGTSKHTITIDGHLSAALLGALDGLKGLHTRICPRQILGVRMGILGGRALSIELPQADKRMYVFVETDGCLLDGVTVATGCEVGRRTMRVIDYGKVAATFIDTQTGEAIRVAPRSGIREAAQKYAPHAQSRWHAQLEGYQQMPTQELLQAQFVQLNLDLGKLISKPGLRVSCDVCCEEIMNEREVIRERSVLCRSCAGEPYYRRVRLTDFIPA